MALWLQQFIISLWSLVPRSTSISATGQRTKLILTIIKHCETRDEFKGPGLMENLQEIAATRTNFKALSQSKAQNARPTTTFSRTRHDPAMTYISDIASPQKISSLREQSSTVTTAKRSKGHILAFPILSFSSNRLYAPFLKNTHVGCGQSVTML